MVIVPFAIGSLALCLFRGISISRASEAATASAPPPGAEQESYPVMTISHDQRISGHISNLPLDKVLLTMSGKNLFAIKGGLPLGETVSATFIDVPLETALGKLLRGYNYVIVKQGPGAVPLLMVIGKAARPNPVAQSTFAGLRRTPGPYSRPRYVPPAAANPKQQAIAGSSTGFRGRTDPQAGNASSADKARGPLRTRSAAGPGKQGGKAATPQSKSSPAGQAQGTADNQPSGKTGFPSTPGNTGVRF